MPRSLTPLHSAFHGLRNTLAHCALAGEATPLVEGAEALVMQPHGELLPNKTRQTLWTSQPEYDPGSETKVIMPIVYTVGYF